MKPGREELSAVCGRLRCGFRERWRPAHRRVGIARALMGRAHRHAAQHGITRLVLDVLPARAHLISFYCRLGYTAPSRSAPNHLCPWSTCNDPSPATTPSPSPSTGLGKFLVANPAETINAALDAWRPAQFCR